MFEQIKKHSVLNNILKVMKAVKNNIISNFEIKYIHGHNQFCSKLLRLLLKMLNFKFRLILTIEEYLNLHPENIEVIISEKVKLSYIPPIFYNEIIFDTKLINEIDYCQYLVLFKKASILGGSSILLLDDKNVYYSIKSMDQNCKYIYSDIGVKSIRDNYMMVKETNTTKFINQGIWIGGNYSWNYYHLVFEFLIKLFWLNKINIPLDIPIIVDDIILNVPQYNELLNMINIHKRDVIGVKQMEQYRINYLYFANCPNLIPPDFKNIIDIQPKDILFNDNLLFQFRTYLLKKATKNTYFKRIYISRKNANKKRTFNEDAVYSFLMDYGFVTIMPENYSIADQIAIFNQAEYIIGGIGAAFTNLLFCKEGCKILSLAKNQLPFSTFTTIAWSAGANLINFTEVNTKCNDINSIHDSYNIDIIRFKCFIDGWLN